MLNRFVKTAQFVNDVRTRFNPKHPILKSDGEWLKHRLQDMGPTYVKIGQFVSTRVDVFDKNIVTSLKELQDRVRPVDDALIKDLIRQGVDINNFKSIEKHPIASASIGQVHKAVLKNNKQVVIKIKRPNITETIKEDISILLLILNAMEFCNVPNISESRELVENFQAFVLQEADYANEVANMDIFVSTNKNKTTILLPKIIKQYSTDEAIVMSYVPCTKFSELKSIMTLEERSKMAYNFMDIFVQQLIFDGVLHGDPHEGNVGYDVAAQKFVIYDMGNIITLDANLRMLMKQFIFEIMLENLDNAIDVMKRIDLINIRDEARLRVYLEKYVEYIKTIDIKVFTMSDKEVFKSLPVKLDGVIFRLIRVFGLIEGICKDLDPNFNYNTVFMKYVDTLVMDQDFIDYKIRSDLRSILGALIKGLDLKKK
jgi:predicted unusual protein kinase regulating ubiquinone biosynthesis (AarF/ABC1/UbiB family)